MMTAIEINKGLKLKIDKDGKGTLSQDKGFDVSHDINLTLEDAHRIVRYFNKLVEVDKK
jgi:hypothetical protein